MENPATEPPALIGLAEVENRFVLNQLVNETPLARLNYNIIHKDSQDERGIDVALLYRPSRFKLLKINFIPDSSILSKVAVGKDADLKNFKTRWVLYAKGIVNELDTLHVLVNHWPSKLGGEQKTLRSRMLVSNVVRCFTDSILLSQPDANIILMGDFNDTPESEPLKNLLGFKNCALSFLSSHNGEGTHKYNGRWETLDQFLISQHLVYKKDILLEHCGRSTQWIFCTDPGMEIFKSDFLLQKDKMFLGAKLKKDLKRPAIFGRS
jgi:predicted extracellular nuclease